MADVQLTGERIAYHRKRLGLSQVELASLIGRSDSWLSQVERGVRAVDRMAVLQKAADVLGVPVAELRGTEPDDAKATERPGGSEALRLVLTGSPAIAVLGGQAQALTRERLAELRERRDHIWLAVHGGRYVELAPSVASLIPELEQAVMAGANAKLTQAARSLLSDTYQAVAAAMAKLGEAQAASIAADRAAFAAEMLHDRLAVAASLFRMAQTFLTLGQIGQAQAVARTVIGGLDQGAVGEPLPETLSLCGAFHLVLATTAARDNDGLQAHWHLDRAEEIADHLGGDRNDFGTEFGQTNVALHAVGVAAELGDAEEALDLARRIEPGRLSAERRAGYNINLAQAHAIRSQIDDALWCLEEAERLSAKQTRTDRVARAVARDLIRLSGSQPRPELRELAERFRVWP
ncbi:MAG TPA: helix-turn-helix transcriptional regulator [Trebonia sp.]|nr:helix-turn-helix transcriptional regulator [Trebonia sp.]